jgi:hypothetical protein
MRPLAKALRGVEFVESWSGYALKMQGKAPVLAQFPELDVSGRTNITCQEGTIRFWFCPNWGSASLGGTGPGVYGRLLELGAWTERADYGWWSLYLNPDGTELYFAGQASGESAEYLRATIQWPSNEWHQVALAYSPTHSALYLDGQLAAEGSGVHYWPDAKVRTALGFFVGSDFSGQGLAQGQFDELATFALPCSAKEIALNYSALRPVVCLGPITPEEEQRRRSQAAARARGPRRMRRTSSGTQTLMSAESTATAQNFGPTDLWLEIADAGDAVRLILHNTAAGVPYQVLSRPNLYGSFWMVEQEFLGGENQDWTETLVPKNSRPTLFFRVGIADDSDGDGLSDTFELIVTGTDPTTQKARRPPSNGNLRRDRCWSISWNAPMPHLVSPKSPVWRPLRRPILMGPCRVWSIRCIGSPRDIRRVIRFRVKRWAPSIRVWP